MRSNAVCSNMREQRSVGSCETLARRRTSRDASPGARTGDRPKLPRVGCGIREKVSKEPPRRLLGWIATHALVRGKKKKETHAPGPRLVHHFRPVSVSQPSPSSPGLHTDGIWILYSHFRDQDSSFELSRSCSRKVSPTFMKFDRTPLPRESSPPGWSRPTRPPPAPSCRSNSGSRPRAAAG